MAKPRPQPKAAPKTTPKRVERPKAAKAAKSATARGFASVDAMKSAQRGMGLIQQADGSYKKVTQADVQGMADRLGQGADQTAATPYNVGGARWMFGQGGAVFTGQRSDAAARNPGAAYNAPESEQTPYLTGEKAHAKARGQGAQLGGTAVGAGRTLADAPYAEADVATTSYLRAQGKAYAQGKVGGGAYSAGGTGTPDESAVVEDAAGGGGAKKKKTKKQKANLKVRGKRKESGVKAGSHINKAGKAVANKGGKKAGKNSGR
jgi:hypothetical protein